MTTDNQLPLNDDILDDALAMVAAGIPVEVILAEAGADAAWLRPLLVIAGEVGGLKNTVTLPPPTASLNKMLAHAQKLAATPPPVPAAKWSWFDRLRLGSLFSTGLRAAALTAVVLIAFLAGTVMGSGITMAAQNSLPGQPFYGLKRMGESVRLNMLKDEQHRQRLSDTFNLERRFETDQLLDRGREVEVVFEDQVQSLSSGGFVVGEGEVQLTAQTEISGELTPGARVRIRAVTLPARVLQALSVSVIQPAPSTPTPTATPSPTAAPTQTPLVTPTLAKSGDTLVLPVLPTATPLPPNDNSNSAAADNQNNNSGPDDDDDDRRNNTNVSNDNSNDDADGGDDSGSDSGTDDQNDNDSSGDDSAADGSTNTNSGDDSGDDSPDDNSDGGSNSGSGGDSGSSDDSDSDDSGSSDDDDSSDDSDSDDSGSSDDSDSDDDDD